MQECCICVPATDIPGEATEPEPGLCFCMALSARQSRVPECLQDFYVVLWESSLNKHSDTNESGREEMSLLNQSHDN